MENGTSGKDSNVEIVKAYNNIEFLNSPEARVIRIMAEYLEPYNRLEEHNVEGTVAFFGSARIKAPETIEKEREALQRALENASESERQEARKNLDALERQAAMTSYYEDAVELARRITEWSISHTKEGYPKQFVVCSGGGPGIMEAANRGADLANGESVGLNISLPFEQTPNPYISPTLNFEFHYFFMRKLYFMSLANAIVVFPGGFGTFDELMETLTLVQTGKVTKNLPIVLYGTEFWDKVMNLDHLVETGMISQDDPDLLYRADNVDDAFTYLTERLSAFHDLAAQKNRKIDPGHIDTDLEDV